MNSAYGITEANLLAQLPRVLAEDENTDALGAAAAEVLAAQQADIALASIYARIDELPEGLLDILAYDFKVDWYDYDASLDIKRATIKDCFFIHRTRGTKAAVARGVREIIPTGTVSEWWEFGGDPYYFRILIDVTNIDITGIPDEQVQRLLKNVSYWKAVRSHLEKIIWTRVREPEHRLYYGEYTVYGRMVNVAGEAPPVLEDEYFTELTDEMDSLLLDM